MRHESEVHRLGDGRHFFRPPAPEQESQADHHSDDGGEKNKAMRRRMSKAMAFGKSREPQTRGGEHHSNKAS